MPEGTFHHTFPHVLRKPDSVRIALPADKENLYALLMKLHDTNFFGLPYAKYLPMDPGKIWAHVWACCHGDAAVAGVIDSDDGLSLIGSVGVFYTVPWWSLDGYLTEHWLFVDPAHRDENWAAQLFKFSQWHRADMSTRLGYDIPMEVSVLSSERLPAKEKLWGRYAKKIGAVFWTDGSHG